MTPRASRTAGRRATPERKQRILDVAVDIAVEDGYAGVTVQAVAARAGYVRQVVYDCFGTPEKVLDAALEREAATLMGIFAETIGRVTGLESAGLENLSAAVAHVATAARKRPSGWLLFHLPAEGAPAVVQERIEAVQWLIRRAFVHVLESALNLIDEPGPDIEITAHLLHAVSDELIRLVITEPETYPVDRIVRFFETLTGGLRLPN